MSTAASSSPALPGTPSRPPGTVDARAAGVMVLLCLTWSLQQVSLKAVATQASPTLMVALRSIVAALLLAALMRRRGEGLHRDRWGPSAAAGVLFGIEYLLVSQALLWTHASHVVVFLYTAPMFAALGLQARLPQERLTRAQWAGIALAFSGIALAFLGGHRGATSVHAPHVLWGDALALLAGSAWGATTVTIRCSSLAAAPATELLLYQLLGAVALLLPVALVAKEGHADFTPAVWAHLGFQSLVVSFASFLAWCWLLGRYLASQLDVFSFLTPLFGVLLGAWLLGEPLDAAFVAGGAFALAGIARVSVRRGVMRAQGVGGGSPP